MSEEKPGSPPLYPTTYTATPQSYQQYPMGQLGPATAPPPGSVNMAPAQEVQHHDESNKRDTGKLEDLGDVDPASLIPGKGPGGAPQQYFNVS